MGTFHEKPGYTDALSQTDEWVLESCFLDLLVDEEEPEDLDDWARDHGWSTIFTTARERMQKVLLIDKDSSWRFADSVLKSELNDPQQVAELFLNVKAARARASLDCDRTRYNYAQYHDETLRQLVPKHLEVVRNILDANVLDSLAAFGLIQRNPEALKEQWSILAALFHSEVCASGTTADVSYGMARAFDAFFSRSPKLRWRWLFRRVSTHNQGRGWSHQGNHLECIRLLEPLLEDFDSRVEEEDRKYLPLAVRLVLFPAVFTFAEALKDCHRSAEAVLWLRRAWDKDPNPYWKSRLDVELRRLGEGRQAALPEIYLQPKLMNQKQQLEYLKNERQISEGGPTDHLDGCAKAWADALGWKIRWHEGDPVNLPGTIQGVAQSVQTVSAALKEYFKTSGKNQKMESTTYKKCLSSIDEVLRTLKETILNTPGPVLRFLSPENELADLHLTLKQGINVWKPLKSLMSALEATIRFRDELMARPETNHKLLEPDFAPWLHTLEKRLSQAWNRKYFSDGARFADVASDQQVFELLKNPEVLCPDDPTRHRRKNCDVVPNCVTKFLQLGDQRSKLPSPTSQEPTGAEACAPFPFPVCCDRRKVASTMYLLSRMSRTEAEFTRFLCDPSLELCCDRKKKDPVTPWTEFISLRRWNSFSPNLASRTTTTVGGGYLVRVWNGRRYVGIAIDPGYNFLENLFDEGFTLPDVHVIVVTHAHPDHVENLSNILTLLRERENRIRKVSRVFLVLTAGVFQRFNTLIDNDIDFIEDVVLISWASRPNRDTVHVVGRAGPESEGMSVSLRMGHESSPLVSIQAVPAIHADGTEFDSMGVVLQVPGQEGHRNLRIGFTGDTRYTSTLCSDGGFAGCDVLVPHLGSVIKNEAFHNVHESWRWRLCDQEERLKKAVEQLQPTLTEKNHLYLPGIAMLLCDLKKNPGPPPLIVLSEFGEELRGGLRADLATRLHCIFEMTVLPADVGLRVGVEDRSVRCAICRQYVSAEAVRPVAAPDEDEALVFVCNDCYGARQHELPILIGRIRKATYEPQVHTDNLRGSESGED